MSQTTQTPSDPASRLDLIFRKAIAGAMSEEGEFDPVIRPAQNPKFGDYQCNAAMALGKARRIQPRELAERIIEQVERDELLRARRGRDEMAAEIAAAEVRSCNLAGRSDGQDGRCGVAGGQYGSESQSLIGDPPRRRRSEFGW